METSIDLSNPLSSAPRIAVVDRLNDGLVIQFENGACGYYSDAFLFSKLPECAMLKEGDGEW